MAKGNPWTESELKMLRALYPTHHNSVISSRLGTGRTERAIYKKANYLGLHKTIIIRDDLPYNVNANSAIVWTSSMLDTLRREFPITTNEDLSVILGVSQRSVTRKARELGLWKNRAWLRALWQTNVKLAYGQNKLIKNKGVFYKGMPPTASSFKPGHVPATIQPVIRLDNLHVYRSTVTAAHALRCCQPNVSAACRRKGNVCGIPVRFCKDMPCGSCKYLVGLSYQETQGDAICGCGLDSHITTTDTTGCKKYKPLILKSNE